MTTAEILANIRSELVEPVQGFWSDNELIMWLNRAQLDYARQTNILEDTSTSSTEASVGIYPLPENCLSVKAIFLNIATTGQTPNWIRLIPSNLEKNAQQTPNFTSTDATQTGQPGSYMIWGRELYLFPVPLLEGSDNILMFYKAKPIDITASNSPVGLDSSLHDALIAYVLWKAYAKAKEKDDSLEQQVIYMNFVKQGRAWVKKQSGDQKWKLDIISRVPFQGPFDNRFNPLA